MTVTVYATKDHVPVLEHDVNMSYENFYGLMGELGINPRPQGSTVGDIPIVEFRDKLENNDRGMYVGHTVLLLRMIRLAMEQGADMIVWA